MPNITVSPANADRLSLLARAWAVTPDSALGRLLDDFMRPPSNTDADGALAAPDRVVAVHAVYNGERIEGQFFPDTSRLEILSGPCNGRTYKTPSGAAIAVVQALNPSVNPNRNGWSFWIVTGSGRTLQSERQGK